MQVLKEMNGSEGNPNFIIVNLLQKSGRDTAVPFALKPTVIVPRQIDPLIEVEENVQRAPHNTYSSQCWTGTDAITNLTFSSSPKISDGPEVSLVEE